MSTANFNIDKNIAIGELPSIPHTLVKLIQYFNQDNIEFEQIQQLIKNDPALTSKIIDIANSAQYVHFSLKDFKNILITLGIDTIKNVTTTAAVYQFFSQFNDDNNNLLGNFWMNAIKAAYFAKSIAKLISYPHLDEAFLGGLIHRIGQLIFISRLNNEYQELYNEHPLINIAPNEEIKIFAMTGAELGAHFVSQWPTDTLLADAIYYQNASLAQLIDADPIIKIIHIAKQFGQLDQENESTKLNFYKNIYEIFSLNHGIVENLITDILDEIKQTAESLNIRYEKNLLAVKYDETYTLN
ncbi:MAG: HDOD domain-containing protein, partial [Gammaproteobacteria bacterium]|nr:HDOD domain-containing protein [Gammaproteobacteria bacterium]